MISLEAAQRKFQFQDTLLDDPDPSLSPEEVMALYANTYPSLTNGSVGIPEVGEDNTVTYTFSEQIGKKG
jgi:PRTRC genetic system protein C